LKLIRTDEVGGLEGALRLERAHGNGDFVRAWEAIGIAGPFEVLSPWELRGPEGEHLVHAGGYAALPFGEMYPPLVDFVRGFLETSTHQGLPQQSVSPWRAALESNLVALLAEGAPSHQDSQVFFSNSGAEAVEAALKFARAARPSAELVVNFSRAYHGKTLGALSLTPNEEYQAPFRPLMPGVVTLPYGDAQALEDALKELRPERVAAIIVEPVQGEGGVIVPPADFLPTLNRLRERTGVLVIADEIQTGLGRCGHLFASLAGGLEPDIVTLAKPLGGGLVPIGATLTRRWIMQRALGGTQSKRHSTTFGGGTLAMAVGLKSLELIHDEGLVARSRRLGRLGLDRLRALQKRYPELFAEVRGAGMLFAVLLQPLLPPRVTGRQRELVSQLSGGLALGAFHRAGVQACYTLNSSRAVRLTPALNMPEDLFGEMFRRVERFAERTPKAWQLLAKAPPATLARLARLVLARS